MIYCVNRKEDPSGWIAWQKGKWRKAVAQRKRRRLEAAAAAAAGKSRREAAGPDPGGESLHMTLSLCPWAAGMCKCKPVLVCRPEHTF